MFRIAEKLNKSKRLNGLINYASVRLAGHRGAPIIVGLVLILVSLVFNLIAAVSNDLDGFFVLGALLFHSAVFIGLLGALLAEPLGRG
jgi:hypothetical protein